MSLELAKGKGEFCPKCGTDLRIMLVKDSIPDFCLKCRFPLMLVAGKYRLVKKLDEGGFAIIYEAEHIHLTRDPKRVIKVIKPEFLTNENLKSRFVREVQVTSALSQRNNHIVRIYDDFGELPNLGYFYIMEYLVGKPLNQVLDDANGLLPVELCYRLFLQLCDAMQAAHQEQIVHRDLKPHNIFIIQQGRESHFLKVIDFGIAKPIGSSKEQTHVTQGILGTPAYMAPEQCINKGIDAGSDIYAMGIILYELLVGETPFVPRDPSAQEEISVMEIMSAHLSTPPPLMRTKLPPGRQIPSALEEVVQKALAKKPEERYASVEEFEQAFLYSLPDAGRPGSYLTGIAVGDSLAEDNFDDLPLLEGNGHFQIEFRHPSETPAPAEPAVLPDLFGLAEVGNLVDSFAMEEFPSELNDHAPSQPMHHGRPVATQQRTDSGHPASRGAVRRVIEIDRRSNARMTPVPPSNAVSRQSNHPATTTSNATQSAPPSSYPTTPTHGRGSRQRRHRGPVVYPGRPGVGRSPLKQTARRSIFLPVLLIFLLLCMIFVMVQTYWGQHFPWGQIFPWGKQKKQTQPQTHGLHSPSLRQASVMRPASASTHAKVRRQNRKAKQTQRHKARSL